MLSETQIRHFCNSLNGEIVQLEKTPFGMAYLVDLSDHRLRRLSTNLLAVITSDCSFQQALMRVRRFCETQELAKADLAIVLIHDRHYAEASKVHDFDAMPESLIFLGDSHVRHMMELDEHEARREFTRYLASKISPKDLAPWEPTIPTYMGNFVGRMNELARLTAETEANYIVTGARRVGKTSLMRRASYLIQKKAKAYDVAYYVTCQSVESPEEFFFNLGEQIAGDPQAVVAEKRSIARFWHELKRKTDGRRAQIFLDEMDGFLKKDAKNGWKWMKDLMWAWEMGWVRFAFGGFREVLRLSSDEHSPFASKARVLPIKPLGVQNAARLVTEPMSDLGFRLPSGFTEYIVHESGGLPHIIHFYCWWCMENGKWEEADSRLLDINTLRNAEKSAEFFHLIIKPAQELFGNSIERASYFVLCDDLNPTPLKELSSTIRSLDSTIEPSTVQSALELLSMTGLVKKSDGNYAVAAPVLARSILAGYSDGKAAAQLALQGGNIA